MHTHNPKPTTQRASPMRPLAAPAATAPGERDAPRPSTKQDVVLSLLRRSEGATIPAIMHATGWQAHSVRGFLAGVVRRKLGLTLSSGVSDGQRAYRVTAPKPARVRVRTKTADAASTSRP